MRNRNVSESSAKIAEITTAYQDDTLMDLLEEVDTLVLTSTHRDAKMVDGLGFRVTPLVVDSVVSATTLAAVINTMKWAGRNVPSKALILVSDMGGLSVTEEHLFASLYGNLEVHLIMGDRGGKSLRDFEFQNGDAFKQVISVALERKTGLV